MNDIPQEAAPLHFATQRRDPFDWYSPVPGSDGLHVPTVRAVLDAFPADDYGARRVVERLLPPDPMIERARELHAAARSARASVLPDHGSGGFTEPWNELTDALRKFWITMARIDRERDG